MTKLMMDDATGLSLGGVLINQEEDGTFEVPEHLVELAKGYGAYPPVALVAPENDKPVPLWTNDELRAKAIQLHLPVKGLIRPDLIKAVAAAVKAGE